MYIRATDRLFNGDHNEIYFKGMPVYNGMVWQLYKNNFQCSLDHFTKL